MSKQISFLLTFLSLPLFALLNNNLSEANTNAKRVLNHGTVVVFVGFFVCVIGLCFTMFLAF